MLVYGKAPPAFDLKVPINFIHLGESGAVRVKYPLQEHYKMTLARVQIWITQSRVQCTNIKLGHYARKNNNNNLHNMHNEGPFVIFDL